MIIRRRTLALINGLERGIEAGFVVGDDGVGGRFGTAGDLGDVGWAGVWEAGEDPGGHVLHGGQGCCGDLDCDWLDFGDGGAHAQGDRVGHELHGHFQRAIQRWPYFHDSALVDADDYSSADATRGTA